jgi:hypothetical protein
LPAWEATIDERSHIKTLQATPLPGIRRQH